MHALPDDQLLRITVHFTDGTTTHLSESQEDLKTESPYFTALLNFSEGGRNAVEIKEIDRIGFGYILNWFKPEQCGLQTNHLKDSKEDLIRAYVVADRLMMNRFQDLALAKLHKAGQCTTTDLMSAYRIGLAQSSPLIKSLERRVAWDWVYGNEGGPHACKPDELIMQGGEPAWSLMAEIWKAYNYTARERRLNDDQIRRFPGSTGIGRLKSLQRCGESADSPVAQGRVEFTIHKLEDRTCRLTSDFKEFIECGGLLVWKFVKLWVQCCRCRLRFLDAQGQCAYHGSMIYHCSATRNPRDCKPNFVDFRGRKYYP